MKRGFRNNNPGNIERTATRWQGMSDDQSTDPRFIVFSAAKWGIRAIARILITYQDRRRAADGSPIDTVSEVIHRWAPPHENPTSAYQTYVANQLKLSAYEEIDVYEYNTMYNLVTSIITFENGSQHYDKDTIDQGLRLAGIDVPMKPLKESRTIKGGTTAAAATGASVVVETLNNATTMLEPMSAYVDTVKYVLVGLTLISVGIMVWARIDDMNKEAR